MNNEVKQNDNSGYSQAEPANHLVITLALPPWSWVGEACVFPQSDDLLLFPQVLNRNLITCPEGKVLFTTVTGSVGTTWTSGAFCTYPVSFTTITTPHV